MPRMVSVCRVEAALDRSPSLFDSPSTRRPFPQVHRTQCSRELPWVVGPLLWPRWCRSSSSGTVTEVTFAYRKLHPSALSLGEINRWRELQQGNPALESPFFCPEFSLVAGQQRADAAVTVIERNGQIVGFFPFQVARLGLGGPIGGILSDYQGVIAAADTAVDVPRMLSASGLRRWTFAELIATQPGLHAGSTTAMSSPVIDLSGGYENYLCERALQTDFFKQTQTGMRRLERRVGAVRFEARVTSPDDLQQLRNWKSAQYIASGFADLLAVPWAIGLTDGVMSAEGPGFTGMLSALYVNDRMIAAHLGMASSKVWHWWLPAYSHDFAQFSPGRILLALMAEHAASIGVERIDLGTGPDSYKARVANASVEVLAGSVESNAVYRSIGRMHDATISGLRRSETVRTVVRRARRLLRR